MNCRVVIDRGTERVEHFDGVIVGETTSHYLVTHRSNPVGEWFAKDAKPTVHVTTIKTAKHGK